MLFKRTTIAALILAFASVTFAHNYPGYVVDSSEKLVRSVVTGECIKTGTWVPENLIPECGGPVAKVEAPTPTPVEEPVVKIITPEPVAATPLPEIKTIEVVIEKAVPINLSAQVLFDFDEFTLTSGGVEILSAVAEELKKVDYKVIKLDGYTDRFGSAKYNLKLSQKRANIVKAFLAFKGVDTTKIKAVGYGKTNFITTVEDCKNFKSAGLKACYSQDRRVSLTLN
ncbi:MAG TPA: hypothetical protein DIW31_06640 [Bacteroidales bacterium]|nr:hypothetical protein [Bacteroidales bacterium]